MYSKTLKDPIRSGKQTVCLERTFDVFPRFQFSVWAEECAAVFTRINKIQ